MFFIIITAASYCNTLSNTLLLLLRRYYCNFSCELLLIMRFSCWVAPFLDKTDNHRVTTNVYLPFFTIHWCQNHRRAKNYFSEADLLEVLYGVATTGERLGNGTEQPTQRHFHARWQKVIRPSCISNQIYSSHLVTRFAPANSLFTSYTSNESVANQE